MNQVKNKEEKVVRLAKPVHKGLLRLVFSRFLIFFLLMLFQLGILFSLFEWMNVVVPYFASLQILLTVMIIIYLFNSRMDPSAKLTWMWIIALMPMAGGFFLLFSRVNLGYRKLSRDVREQIDETRTILPQNSQVLREVKEDGSGKDGRYIVCVTRTYPDGTPDERAGKGVYAENSIEVYEAGKVSSEAFK